MDFTDNQNLYLGISEKKDGPMKDSPKNRLLFFKNLNLDNKIIVSAGLVHKNKVLIVNNINKSQPIPNCDALITDQNKYLLTITVADCLPIYFYDKKKKVIALAHAGWRGLVAEIVKKVVERLINHYHSDLNDLEIFVGPHLQACHFEVKDDVARQFKAPDLIRNNKKIYINLSRVAKNQLIQAGVPDANINISHECAYCLDNKYFSYRRDKLEKLETMIAYLGLK